MVRINDIEEKKLIIAYSKACSKKQDEILDNRSVYATWRSLWIDDFRYRGVCLRMRKNKFCTTKNSKKKCVCPSYVLKECNTFISSITEWLNDVYNQNGSKKENKEYFEKMIFAYRKSAFAELEQLLKDSGLEAAGYYLTDYTNKRNPIRITHSTSSSTYEMSRKLKSSSHLQQMIASKLPQMTIRGMLTRKSINS